MMVPILVALSGSSTGAAPQSEVRLANQSRVKPEWAIAPSLQGVKELPTPHESRTPPPGGWVAVTCRVHGDGTLSRCRILSENVGDCDDEKLALLVVGSARLRPTLHGDSVAGAVLNLTITFKNSP